MAKNGVFKTSAPATVDPTAGISAREVLSFVTGKKDFTNADVDSWIKREGLSDADARRVRAGSSQFFKTGHDYRLTDDGNYNVISSKGPKMASSRETGNRKGFNPGDLVGLGNNLASFMGLVGKYKGLYSESVAKAPTPQTNGANSQFTLTSAKPGAGATTVENKQAVQAKATGARKPGARVPVTGESDEQKRARIIAEFNERKKGWDKKYGRTGGPEWFATSPYAKYVNMGQVKPEQFSEEDINKKKQEYAWNLMTSLYEKRPNKGLLDIPTGGFTEYQKEIPEKRLESLMDDYEKILRSGYDVRPPHEDYITGETVLNNSDVVASDAELAESMALMGLGPKVVGTLSRNARFLKTNPFFRKYMMGKAPLNPIQEAEAFSKAARPTLTAAQLVGSGAKAATEPVKGVYQKLLSRQGKNIKLPKTEAVSAEEALTPGTRQFSRVKGTPNYKDAPFSEETLANPARKVSRVPGTPNYEAVGEFKKGGKMVPKAQNGRLVGYNPDGSEMYEYTGNVKPLPFTPKSLVSGKIPLATLPKPLPSTGGKDGRFKTKTPATGQMFGNESTTGDALGKAAKYILPFIGEAMGRAELDKYKPAKFTPANLMSGTVYALPRPNFRLRHRNPTGPDMVTEIAGQKFADSQASEAERNFNIQDALSRIQQRERIVDRTNQGEMFNTQQRNMNELYNAQIQAGITGQKAQSYREPFLAAQHHLATDIGTDAVLKTDRRTALASEVIRNRDSYTKEQVQQAEQYLGRAKGGRVGRAMKFKTKKFAYGR